MATHNQSFSGDSRDQRSWSYWVTMWLSMVRPMIVVGGYAQLFVDWRQLPALTDAYQAAGFLWRGLVPWDKTSSSRAPHTGYYRHQCEYVVWGTHGELAPCQHGGPFPGLITERVVPSEKHHMTGKPVGVMAALCAPVVPGGVILDPFAGSGSTGVAALLTGRRFVGIELDPYYFDVACRRLEEAARSVDLLQPSEQLAMAV